MKPIIDPLLLLWFGVLLLFIKIVLAVLKKRKAKKSAVQEEPKIWFSPDSSGGEMEYESEEGNFKMEYEFGSGNAIAIINLPGVENWHTQTGLSLERRAAVLNFIGEKALEKQANGIGTFTLEGNIMIIWGEKSLQK